MPKFIINGGKPLRGAVRLGGAKNASFKLMIASALGTEESRLLNLSNIGDVQITAMTLEKLGSEVKKCGDNTYFIRPALPNSPTIPQIAGEKSRASTLFAAILLSRIGEAYIPFPGGCSLGPRPIDRHLDAFRALGAVITESDEQIHLKADQLTGTTFRFPKKTHTGTEAMILAAARAHGQTIIENAGLEPEIDDLIEFINKMGGQIRRAPNDTIMIDGVQDLKGAIHRVMPDRNEAVSYACAALATRGDIVLEDAVAEHLKFFLDKVTEIGGNYQTADYGIRIWWDKPLKATDMKTAAEPGFMTDWQQLWCIIMTQAEGESHIIEAVHNNRLQFTDQLNRMGADITLYNPQVEDPESYYDFNIVPGWDTVMHAAKIIGPTTLKADQNLTVPDLRGGATLTIAALVAQGQSVINGTDQIERGYENLHERLVQLGADIERVEE